MEGRAELRILDVRPTAAVQFHNEAVRRALLANLDALYGTAKRLVGRVDVAQDLVQEAARKALETPVPLKDDRNTRAWLFRILMNGLKDYLRRAKRWSEVPIEEVVADLDPVSESLAISTAEDVRRALSNLRPEIRAIAILIDMEGFTIAEAAAILQIPPGTAASRLLRSRHELQALLKSYQSRSSRSGG
jgi:RNA polymerase sigma-70 factor (ECF subfamily)